MAAAVINAVALFILDVHFFWSDSRPRVEEEQTSLL